MVRVKIALARIKWAGYRLGLWALGVVTGVSFLISGYLYQLEVAPLVFENEPVVVTVANEEATKEGDWIVAEVSAYSAGDGFTPGTTMASGKHVYIGAVACPSFLKLGQQVEFRGLGVFTCEDRMAKRYRDGSFFDLYKGTRSEALAFGRQSLKYRLADPVL